MVLVEMTSGPDGSDVSPLSSAAQHYPGSSKGERIFLLMLTPELQHQKAVPGKREVSCLLCE